MDIHLYKLNSNFKYYYLLFYRLLTGECDKTIKIYKEDEDATEETHPITNFKVEYSKPVWSRTNL